jgi:hypothetical protein
MSRLLNDGTAHILSPGIIPLSISGYWDQMRAVHREGGRPSTPNRDRVNPSLRLSTTVSFPYSNTICLPEIDFLIIEVERLIWGRLCDP